MYTVYALWNNKNGKIYIGQTKDIDQRLQQHENKLNKKSFTAKFGGEWMLVYAEEKENRKEALSREKQLKSYQGREFIKKIINSKF